MENILTPISREQLQGLSRNELIELLEGEQSMRQQLMSRLADLEDQIVEVNDKYVKIKHKYFGKSSEKKLKPKSSKSKKPRKKRGSVNRNLSERYPDAEVVEQHLELQDPGSCACCGNFMEDSGMNEISEQLTVIPKKYIILRTVRHKYRCRRCHGSIVTTPQIPRIKPGSSYSDEMIIDASLSKYCDLIPMERYTSIAARQGFEGIPPHSLIGLTHILANFLNCVMERLRKEILEGRILRADETPHKMLEGDEKNSWYLWGFSTEKGCFFECHDTRSGDVASNILDQSNCEILLTDVYSGYSKAIREANHNRVNLNRPEIKSAYCNAHARRRFKEASLQFDEAQEFLDNYSNIYGLHSQLKDNPSKDNQVKLNQIFEDMNKRSVNSIDSYSTGSSMYKAMSYFTKNYEGLTLFLQDLEIPIDNNAQEASFRNPVIGRKTWSGTHSKRGAKTAAVMFSLIESCKVNGVNPRKYFKDLVQDLHQEKTPYTPWEYKEREKT